MLTISSPKVKQETGSAFAYRVLKENIMTLVLAPGTSLEEAELTLLLGISRTPVREALLRLKQEHLVEIIPQSGSSVAFIEFPLVHEALFLRSTLEPFAIQQAAELAPPYLLTGLYGNLQEQKEILEKSHDYAAFFRLDNAFHQLIYQAAGLEHLWENILMLSTHYDRLRYLDIILGSVQLEPLFQTHMELFEKIKANKTEVLGEYVTAHLSSFLTTKTFLLPEFRSYFKGL